MEKILHIVQTAVGKFGLNVLLSWGKLLYVVVVGLNWLS